MNSRAIRLVENRWGFIAFMAIMCTLSPFAMSFLVPAFPSMAAEFDKPVGDIQLLVSVFLIGLGVAQPVHGILADKYGRRPVLLMGFFIFVIASLASVLTTSWTALVACRFLQAVGVSAGTVTSRAIVNDIQPREEAAITLSYISIAMGVGPIISPIFGGILDVNFGWRSIFIGCFLAGFIILVLAILRLPETRPNDVPQQNILKNYKALLGHSQFIGYTLMFGFGQGVFFAFLPFAPDYFATVLNQSTTVFVISWIGLSLAFMTGSLLGARVTKRYGMDRAIMGASIWLVFALFIIIGAYAIFGDGVWSTILPLMLAMLATGLICPLSLAGSISVDAKLAGTAAGLSSAIGLVIGGMFTVISGKIYDMTLWPFIGLAALSILGNLFAAWLSAKKPQKISA